MFSGASARPGARTAEESDLRAILGGKYGTTQRRGARRVEICRGQQHGEARDPAAQGQEDDQLIRKAGERVHAPRTSS